MPIPFVHDKFGWGKATAEDLSGRTPQLIQVLDSDVEGVVLLFGNDFEIMSATEDVTLVYLHDTLPRWWWVGNVGGKFRVRAHRGGLICGITGNTVSAIPTTSRILRLASSLPLTVADPLDLNRRFRSRLISAIPGAFVGEGSKPESLVGSAGYNQIVAYAGQPVYIVMRFNPPQDGALPLSPATATITTPIFIQLNTQAGPVVAAQPGYILGDMAGWIWASSRSTVILATLETTYGVGVWFPAQERDPGGTYSKWRVDVSVWGLSTAGARSLPGGGAGGGVPGFGGAGLQGSPGAAGGGGGSGVIGGPAFPVIGVPM